MKKLVMFLVFSGLVSLSPAFAMDVGLMSVDELKGILGNDDVIVLDARSGKDWSSSEFKIEGAIRANPREFATWGESHPKDKRIVLYCA